VDIQAYIQSGIIESYVLGLASADEVAEIEKLRLQYSEVEDAIDQFSVMLEEHAAENAVVPPLDVKQKIMAAIKEEEEIEDDSIPVERLSATRDVGSVVHLVFFKRWRMVAAAAIILLICSAALNIYFYDKYRERHSAYLALLSERNSLQANNQLYQTRLNEWRSISEMMAAPEMLMVKMPDVSGKNAHLATIFWNTKSKDVYVMPNKLPVHASNKQFQLWALVDGKPVDAGMLDDNCNGVCQMKNIPKAEAFAITLENAGGSSTPTMEAMVVLGKV